MNNIVNPILKKKLLNEGSYELCIRPLKTQNSENFQFSVLSKHALKMGDEFRHWVYRHLC